VTSGSAFDADAQAFFNRVTTAGGTLSVTEQNAVNTLVIALKADGIWTKTKAIYPMVGASAAACSRNLKSDNFNGTFSSGWTFASTGVQGNGTSAFMNTFLVPSLEFELNSHSYGIYLPDNFNSAIVYSELGAFGPGDYGTMIYGSLSNATYNRVNSSEWNGIYNKGNGFMISSRTLSNLTRNFLNGVFRIQSTQISTLRSSFNYYIGARGNGLSGVLFSPKLISFVFFADGLDDTEANNFYTRVQAFQTTLSRQV
jgi:hypothetical protein